MEYLVTITFKSGYVKVLATTDDREKAKNIYKSVMLHKDENCNIKSIDIYTRMIVREKTLWF